jgi:hypothetical protein
MIRARLQELSRERAAAALADADARTEGSQPLRDAEKRSKERREGSPPPRVRTIFVKAFSSRRKSSSSLREAYAQPLLQLCAA